MPFFCENSMKLHCLPLTKISWSAARDIQYQIRDKVKRKECHAPILYPCEHDPVFTLGRNTLKESLTHDKQFYIDKNIAVEETDRGGDVTYHGPGQLTTYFIFDMSVIGKDIHKFITAIEECVLHCLLQLGVNANRDKINSGVWIGQNKICAIGLGFKHWISYHGIGFNISTNLEPYRYIVPCGLKERWVTSLEAETGKVFSLNEVLAVLTNSICHVFNFDGFENIEKW